MKYFLHNSNFKNSEIVIFGVPDISGSRSNRGKGVEKAPNKIREVSDNKEIFVSKGGKKRKTHTQTGIITKNICDIGNIKKIQVKNKIAYLLQQGKIPVVLGGDHSITAEILEGIGMVRKNISLVYFDAHPDFICSAGGKYYGSVVCDISKLKNFDIKSSVEIGIRAPEEEEIENLESMNLLTITPFDIQELGIKKTLDKIKKKIGNNVYISIDVDCIDPAYAPGVSDPVPGSLTSAQLIYLVKNLAKLGIIGFDVMEINPKYDIQDTTAHLASRIIAETIQSLH